MQEDGLLSVVAGGHREPHHQTTFTAWVSVNGSAQNHSLLDVWLWFPKCEACKEHCCLSLCYDAKGSSLRNWCHLLINRAVVSEYHLWGSGESQTRGCQMIEDTHDHLRRECNVKFWLCSKTSTTTSPTTTCLLQIGVFCGYGRVAFAGGAERIRGLSWKPGRGLGE